jgi:hypothetical protein
MGAEMADQGAERDSLIGNAWLWEITFLDDADILRLFLLGLQKVEELSSVVPCSTGRHNVNRSMNEPWICKIEHGWRNIPQFTRPKFTRVRRSKAIALDVTLHEVIHPEHYECILLD